jgi:hypothetical protein
VVPPTLTGIIVDDSFATLRLEGQLMSVNPVKSVGGSEDQFIQELVSKIDANQDGRITSGELTSFLKSFLDALSSHQTGGHATGTPQSETDSPPPDVLPSTWTDDNAPYGVTLAGWSPQNHTDLTLADLADPMKAKYAVYNYLRSNRIMPDKTWATVAAEALNTKYNTTIFHAIDGETLGYGDEYVHTASNGWGLLPGQYNPSASGEFLWGWRDV